MADVALSAPLRLPVVSAAFAGAIFTSAALVFSVQPMVAKMILPQLGGSSAVWNTCMVFFQAALLAGYCYAHLLQRVRKVRHQVGVHLGVLVAAGMFLPLGLSTALGDPDPSAPVLWLLGMLTLSVGLPFTALSATAPLVQSWYARAHGDEKKNPYVLYVASNIGSMLSLLAYPLIVEPLTELHRQGELWTMGYAVFVPLIAAAGLMASVRADAGTAALPVKAAPASMVSWSERAAWILLAAAPSSLLLGVTTFISSDVAAVPLIWVVPLALYLMTFVVAFQDKPLAPRAVLNLQAVAAVACLASMGAAAIFNWWVGLTVHLATFFVTALACHQGLAARKPEPARLTEFYLCLSLGGVIGGAFTALLAPKLFPVVVEYPLVLVLAGLMRPWNRGRVTREEQVLVGVGLAACAMLIGLSAADKLTLVFALTGFAVASGAALLLRRRAVLFTVMLTGLALQAVVVPNIRNLLVERSFFGVHRVQLVDAPALGGKVRTLLHGVTIHGAQPVSPAFKCQPTNYFAPTTSIGQTYRGMTASHQKLNVGVVGLGTGSVAIYMRPNDRLRFFEIDPKVEQIARDRRYFTYLSDCAKAPTDVVLGDARLTLAKEPAASYDLLHLDAFSSDSIPTHLLTKEAFQLYFRALKPGGVLMIHITNRHLALEGPVTASGRDVGATAIIQQYRPPKDAPAMVELRNDVVLLAKSAEALKPFTDDKRWRPADTYGMRAWSDDYTNVLGALMAQRKP